MKKENAKLIVKVDFNGTHFYTTINGGKYVKKHYSLEFAQEWLL